jgi:hypothetical protein
VKRRVPAWRRRRDPAIRELIAGDRRRPRANRNKFSLGTDAT